MYSPYIVTLLNTSVNLNPRQMNNQIYKNLKDNLIKKIEGKCYRNFGYVAKVYDIKEYSDGYLIPENPMAAATFSLKFTCKLCIPLRKKHIVCKIEKITNMLISAHNGPITMIITMNRINGDLFYQDQKTGKLMIKNEKKNKEVTPGMYIIATVESRAFNDMDQIIMSIGELNRLATDEEINASFSQEHNNNTNIVNFNDYMKKDNVIDNENVYDNEDNENMTYDEKEEEDLQND